MSQTVATEEFDAVVDEAFADESVASVRYDITSYGADYDVEGLVKRLKRGDIFIPDFQRGYVWNIKEASRFIESLLLGLPVPGIFLAKETNTNKLLVIDGQQRLKSLLFFYDGFFDPKEGTQTKKVFTLTSVQKRFDGCTYESLPEKDRVQLNDSIIHATVIKQESPDDDDTSVYHVFERLNTGGQKLKAQEIRVAAYHGPLFELLKTLNADPNWRKIYGKESKRLKDQELILRFLAMYYDAKNYVKPFEEFLNRFAKRNRNAPTSTLASYQNKFSTTIALAAEAIGADAFKPEGTLNAAVFDSIMVGLARRLDQGPLTDKIAMKEAYEKLLKRSEYNSGVFKATSDESNVLARVTEATAAFASLR